MTKRIHSDRDVFTDPTGSSGGEGFPAFSWLDDESGELLRVHISATSSSFVEELAAMGFLRPPLAGEGA